VSAGAPEFENSVIKIAVLAAWLLDNSRSCRCAFDGRRTRRRHDDVRMSNSLTANEDDAYKAGAWTSRRLAAGGLRQHPSIDAQRHPSVEYPPRHQQHRDSNEYASIWEPWPPTMPDNAQDAARRTGITR